MFTSASLYLEGPNEGGLCANSDQEAKFTVSESGLYEIAILDNETGLNVSIVMNRDEVRSLLEGWGVDAR